jgi:glycosyltransferase involved in cell wall biosynthesis
LNSENLPLVTVVTVTYNSALYVRDAIDSVLAQSYQNIEYIISDDCSKDDTWKIVSAYTDPRIKASRNDRNLGEYANRNKAIEMATGEYLIFIDGDDIIFSHGVGFFVNMMRSFPRAAMAIQKNYINNVLYPALFEPEDTLRNHFYGKIDLLTSSFTSNFFRIDVLKRWGLKTSYIIGDEEIRLRIAANYPVLFVAGWVSWPRETPGQASSRIGGGVGLMEKYRFSREILSDPDLPHLDGKMKMDMENILRRDIARYAYRLLLKGKPVAATHMLRSVGMRWKDAIKSVAYKPSFEDILSEYNPVSPLKKGYLTKIQHG